MLNFVNIQLFLLQLFLINLACWKLRSNGKPSP